MNRIYSRRTQWFSFSKAYCSIGFLKKIISTIPHGTDSKNSCLKFSGSCLSSAFKNWCCARYLPMFLLRGSLFTKMFGFNCIVFQDMLKYIFITLVHLVVPIAYLRKSMPIHDILCCVKTAIFAQPNHHKIYAHHHFFSAFLKITAKRNLPPWKEYLQMKMMWAPYSKTGSFFRNIWFSLNMPSFPKTFILPESSYHSGLWTKLS